MPEPADRRAAERLPVGANSACEFVGPVVQDFGAAKIKDISMQGVGLVIGRRVEVGTVLAVTLSNPARSFTKTALVRVTHATQQPGGCLVGGEFTTALSYQELTALVM